MRVNQRIVWLAIGLVVVALFLFCAKDLQYLWQKLFIFIHQEQNVYRRSVMSVLKQLRRGGDIHTWWVLLSAGFSYGVLHAVGPGHGKAVISTFLLTQPSSYKNALLLAFGGALLQGVSAIIWVEMTLGVLQWLIRESLAQIIWAERLSYAVLIVVGCYLIWRARSKNTHGCSCCTHGHHHKHLISKKEYLSALIAIGIRPCSGSILALAVAASWGLWRVGIAMTFSVSIGTAITVFSLALLTIYGRDKFAQSLTVSHDTTYRFFYGLTVLGGFLLIGLGLFLLFVDQGGNDGLWMV